MVLIFFSDLKEFSIGSMSTCFNLKRNNFYFAITIIYRALLATIRSRNKIAVATATSGVAASILPGGRTAHSRLKVPLTFEDRAFCTFTKQSGTGKLLRTTSLIIWDEVTMMKRQGVEALDNSLRDIMDCLNLPFGGRLSCLEEISGRFSQL